MINQVETVLNNLPLAQTINGQYRCNSYEFPCLISVDRDEKGYFTLDLATDFNPPRILYSLQDFLQNTINNRTVIISRDVIIDSINTNGRRFNVIFKNASNRDMAQIYQIIKLHIPTMAVARIDVNENRTSFASEILFTLIRQIVFNSSTLVPDGVYYHLSRYNDSDRTIQVTADDIEQLDTNYDVVPVKYSIKEEDEIIYLSQTTGIKLPPKRIINGQIVIDGLDVYILVAPGTQEDDARWGCVSDLSFKEQGSNFILEGTVRGNLKAEEIIERLIDYTDQSIDDFRLIDETT